MIFTDTDISDAVDFLKAYKLMLYTSIVFIFYLISFFSGVGLLRVRFL